jgi:hypothetical protein
LKTFAVTNATFVEIHAGQNLARIVFDGNVTLADSPTDTTVANITTATGTTYLPVGKATYAKGTTANITVTVIE